MSLIVRKLPNIVTYSVRERGSISQIMTYLNIPPTHGHLAGNQSTWTSEEVSKKVTELITIVFVWI